jgi:hypothetical protein
VPAPCSYDYAILRVVPCAERGEFVNVGVILHSSEHAFLKSRIHLDPMRLTALYPDLDLDLVKPHLEAFPKVCDGDPTAGPIAQLSRRERFHWLVSPRSTIIQLSPVHSGITSSPEATFEELFQRLVVLQVANLRPIANRPTTGSVEN